MVDRFVPIVHGNILNTVENSLSECKPFYLKTYIERLWHYRKIDTHHTYKWLYISTYPFQSPQPTTAVAQSLLYAITTTLQTHKNAPRSKNKTKKSSVRKTNLLGFIDHPALLFVPMHPYKTHPKCTDIYFSYAFLMSACIYTFYVYCGARH